MLATLMATFPVTGILGPRQSGKTTLAHEFAADHFFDLENPRDAAMLADHNWRDCRAAHERW
jgi:predicted AAA+ superfamily ATPase